MKDTKISWWYIFKYILKEISLFWLGKIKTFWSRWKWIFDIKFVFHDLFVPRVIPPITKLGIIYSIRDRIFYRLLQLYIPTIGWYLRAWNPLTKQQIIHVLRNRKKYVLEWKEYHWQFDEERYNKEGLIIIDSKCPGFGKQIHVYTGCESGRYHASGASRNPDFKVKKIKIKCKNMVEAFVQGVSYAKSCPPMHIINLTSKEITGLTEITVEELNRRLNKGK